MRLSPLALGVAIEASAACLTPLPGKDRLFIKPSMPPGIRRSGVRCSDDSCASNLPYGLLPNIARSFRRSTYTRS